MKPERLSELVTLYQGDCLDVLRGLPDGSFDAVITDPPYGIAFQSARRIETERFDEIANDDQPFVWWLPEAARLLKPGGCLLCFCRWDTAEAFRMAIGWSGLKVGAQLIWDRVGHGMGDSTGRPSPRHDIIWFAVNGRYKLPGKRPTSMYQQQRLTGLELTHPNEKPVPLMKRLVDDYVPSGGSVLDCFAGSGATMVAGALEGRHVSGIEISGDYCDIIRRRVATETAKHSNTLFGDLTKSDTPDLFTEASQ